MPRKPPRMSEEDHFPKLKPAATPEGRETQMIELADALAEKQMREGTASAQVITHYLKLGSTREKLEQEKLKNDTLLTQSKIDQIEAEVRIDQMFAEAIRAIQDYRGDEVTHDQISEGNEDDPNIF